MRFSTGNSVAGSGDGVEMDGQPSGAAAWIHTYDLMCVSDRAAAAPDRMPTTTTGT